jgi:hypothetical protein
MKTVALLSLLLVSCSTFAAQNSGIVSSVHKTIRSKNLVCAVDIVTLSNGKIKTETSCFKI